MIPLRATALAPAPASTEQARLEELADYRILGTWPETPFDEVTQLISTMFRTSMAIVSIVGEHKQWLKSSLGLQTREMARDTSFCTHTITSDDVMVVPDARQDLRFKDNPLVTRSPHIRFYAGAPLLTKNGFRIGALCALDTKPRASFGSREEALLRNFAGLVMTQLELRRDRLPG